MNDTSRSESDQPETVLHGPASVVDGSDVTILMVNEDQTDPTRRAIAPRPAPDCHSRIGDYDILHEIARGGMGVVYKARHTRLGRIAAVKVIRAAQWAGPEEIQRFFAEAQAAANLDHPGIVPVYEAGEESGQQYIAMAFVEGQSLGDRVKAGPLEPREAARVMQLVSVGVHFAHEHGIIHRDLKPQNILLTPAGQPRVTDFGLAKQSSADSNITSTGQILGTPSFMPPEQAAGRTEMIGPTSDVFALGATLYCLLTGRPPFQAANVIETLKQVLDQEPASPRLLNPVIDRDLETICLKCLQKDPRSRYPSAQELADELERFLKGEAIRARSISALARGWRWCKRKPLIAALLTGLALSVVVGVAGITAQWLRAESMVVLAKGEAKRANDNADKESDARQEADKRRREAVTAQQVATEALEVARERLAETYLEHGQSLCDAGEAEQGLLWMIRALESLPPCRTDMERSIRAGLAGWQGRMRPLRCAVQHPSNVASVAFHPAGESFLTGSWDGTAQIWNLASGQALGPPLKHGSRVTVVAFSPDGTTALTGGTDRAVQLWDVASGMPLGERLTYKGEILAAIFTADGKQLVIGTGGAIEFFDIATRKPAATAVSLEPAMQLVGLAPGGELALVSRGNHVQPWNLGAAAKVGPGLKHAGQVMWVSPSPRGRISASGGFGDSKTRLWNVDTGEVVAELPTGHLPTINIAWSADGSLVATANGDGTVLLWNSDGVPRGLPIRHRGHVNALAFNANASALITGCRDGTARVWDIKGETPFELSLPHGGPVYRIAFRSDGARIVTGSDDGLARVWDLPSGDLVGQPLVQGGAVRAVAFSPDGKMLVTGGIEKSTRVWDSQSQKLRGKPVWHKSQIYQAVFLPDGETFLCATGGDVTSPSGVAEFRSATTGTAVGEPLRHEGGVQCVALSPDGSTALTGSLDMTARLWNVQTRKPIGQAMRHDGYVLAVAFAPDGKSVLTGSRDFTARLWSAQTGEPLGKMFQHQGSVWGVAFSPDGTKIATASDDGAARLWDRETGRLIGPAMRHDGMVAGIAFNPQGAMLVTGGGDNCVRIWNVPQPTKGTVKAVALRTQLLTCRQLNADDGVSFLGGAAWQKIRLELSELSSEAN